MLAAGAPEPVVRQRHLVVDRYLLCYEALLQWDLACFEVSAGVRVNGQGKGIAGVKVRSSRTYRAIYNVSSSVEEKSAMWDV